MRKEASLEQWQELYEIFAKIKTLKPWELLFSTDLLCIQLSKETEPVFISIMGKAGRTVGIAMYEGMEGLADFDMVSTCEENCLPLDYVMFEQTALCCYWGDREEVPPAQKKKISQLGLRFRGHGQWLYFESYKRRYAPFIPDEREVRLMTKVGRQMIVLIEELGAKKICANFDSGESLWRAFDEESQTFKSYVDAMPYRQKAYPVLELSDEVLQKRLELKPQNGTSIALEFAYLNVSVFTENGDRPMNPLMFIAVDEDEEQILTLLVLEEGQKEEEVVFGFFISYVMEYGRMDMIRARNPWVLTALEEICDACDVDLAEDDLEYMDELIDDLRERLR